LLYLGQILWTGDDFSISIDVGGAGFTKQPSILEEHAYRDTWGAGYDSYLPEFEILIPALLTVAMAFVTWDGVSDPTFAGLDNFRAIFADQVFFSALLNNLKWTAIFLTIPIIVGLVAASLLLIVRRGRTFFQIVYFLPAIIATVVTARVWQGMIYNPDTGLVGWLRIFARKILSPSITFQMTSSRLFSCYTQQDQ